MDLKRMREEERKTENDKRRQKMVDAAFVCFCQKGIEAASIADIARQAEFGEATVYRYFSNKENIVLECGKKFWGMVLDFFDEQTATEDYRNLRGIEQVERLMFGAGDFYQSHVEAFRLIHNLDGFLLSHRVDAERLAEYEQAVDHLRPCLWNAIEKGKADGSIRCQADTIELYYALTNGIFSLMQKQAAAGSLLSSDLAVEQDRKLMVFLELLIAGLKQESV